MDAFVSNTAYLTVHDSGWLQLANGVEISKLPIWDAEAQLAARLGYGPMGEWLRSRGLRLPTISEYVQLHARALHIDPYTLPTAEMIRSAGIRRPYDSQGNDTPEMRRYRSENIRSRAWCCQHDQVVLARLAAARWSTQPVANFGKHWAAGGLIFGWWRADGSLVQHASDYHGPLYTDYATNAHAARDNDGDIIKIISEPAPASHPQPTSKGDSDVDAVEAWQRYLIAFFAKRGEQALPVYGHDGDHGTETEWWTEKWRDLQQSSAADTDPAPASSSSPLTVDSCVTSYRAARYFGKGRPRGSVNSITLHVAQSSELPTGAESLGDYAATMSDGRLVSWHFACDCDSSVQCVDVDDRAYAAGPGNDRSVHIEICGRVEQGARGWADDYSQATLRRVAELVAALCSEHEIPARRMQWEDLLHDRAGIYGHEDWSSASREAKKLNMRRNPWWNPVKRTWRVTTHADPGSAFPWAQLMQLVDELMRESPSA